MIVAQLRGVSFREYNGFMYPEPGMVRVKRLALFDVASWLGFLFVGGYLEAMRKERERIFERATC